MFTSDVALLHVDDDEHHLELAGTLLEREAHRLAIETATSAEGGLARLRSTDVDCIVSDYDMPGRTGIDFLKTVREDHPDLPFILFTGKGSEEVASEAISAGVTDYLQKETGTEQYAVLANRIENVVAKYRAESLVDRAFQAMDSSREGIALLDDDGEFIYVNERYTEIVGYEDDELIGESWMVVYPDEQVVRIHEDVLDTVPEEGHWTGDTVYQRKDGRRIVVNHALAYSEEGTMICLLRDRTDADAHRRALHEERQRVELLVDAIEDYAIFMLDPDGYVVSWNEGAKRLTGYTEDEALGVHVSLFYTDDQQEAGMPADHLDRARETGSIERRGPRVRKDGSTFQATYLVTAVHDREGRHRGFGKVTRNLSEHPITQ